MNIPRRGEIAAYVAKQCDIPFGDEQKKIGRMKEGRAHPETANDVAKLVVKRINQLIARQDESSPGDEVERKLARKSYRLGEDHRLLPQEPISRRWAHARTRPVCRGRLQSGSDGEADARSARKTGADVTPAGPAVCPHTAKRPENAAGRAACGAKMPQRNLPLQRET